MCVILCPELNLHGDQPNKWKGGSIMEHTNSGAESQKTCEHMMDESRHEQANDDITLLAIEDVFKEEKRYKIWLQNPTNVLAERDDSVVKALCYGP